MNPWLTQRTFTTQGSQTHPSGPDKAHSRYNQVTPQSGERRSPQMTNYGATNTCWRTGQRPVKVPTRDPLRSKYKLKSQVVDGALPTQGTDQLPNRSKHKDNYFYGHNSRTQCNSPRQDMNFFPHNHVLIDSQSSYYHNIIF